MVIMILVPSRTPQWSIIKMISINNTGALISFIEITFIIDLCGVLDGTKIPVEEIRRGGMSCYCPMRYKKELDLIHYTDMSDDVIFCYAV